MNQFRFKYMKGILTNILLAACVFSTMAAPVDEARQLVKEGNFTGARKLLEQAVAANPKISASPEYNYLLGACEFESGQYAEARKLLEVAKSKGYGPANLYLGRLAFLDYDFENASRYYSDFKRHREKLGQIGGETVEELEHQLSIAENALSRVEKIAVIDSISIPKNDFYKVYRLSKSSGRLSSPNDIPFENHRQGASMAYVNEEGDYMIWGEPDEVGNVHLVETIRLTDGTWQAPTPINDELNNGGYADYPFMMPDGVTLYFASDGNESMGGYDIFVAKKDATTGEYLQPQNIGMPFNSPYDDFMLAIDEENGVGWWATDRNKLDGNLTIYMYMVNDLRKNYDEDDDNLLEMARITDFRSTQMPEESGRYHEVLSAISKMDNDDDQKTVDFYFPIGNGKYYHSLSDFKNTDARNAMTNYLKAERKLNELEANLKELRKRFPVNRADNVKDEIVALENEIEKRRIELIKLRSNIYCCLKGQK